MNPLNTAFMDDIVKAYRLLFNGSALPDSSFPESMNTDTLKLAYRSRVMDTHPDRAALLGRPEEEMAEGFREILRAYELLRDYLHSRRSASATEEYREFDDEFLFRDMSDGFYRGGIPSTILLFGQYLYYTGEISWKTLHLAVLWQKNRRPRFGQIALEWGMLTRRDIHEILKKRHHREKFGEYAQREGYISAFQHMAIMGKQSMMQPRIGEYFLRKGHFTSGEIAEFVIKQRMHNQRIRLKRTPS